MRLATLARLERTGKALPPTIHVVSQSLREWRIRQRILLRSGTQRQSPAREWPDLQGYLESKNRFSVLRIGHVSVATHRGLLKPTGAYWCLLWSQ
jgi:hypothetical protein